MWYCCILTFITWAVKVTLVFKARLYNNKWQILTYKLNSPTYCCMWESNVYVIMIEISQAFHFLIIIQYYTLNSIKKRDYIFNLKWQRCEDPIQVNSYCTYQWRTSGPRSGSCSETQQWCEFVLSPRGAWQTFLVSQVWAKACYHLLQSVRLNIQKVKWFNEKSVF